MHASDGATTDPGAQPIYAQPIHARLLVPDYGTESAVMTSGGLPAGPGPSASRALRENISDTTISSVGTLGRALRSGVVAGRTLVEEALRLRFQWREAMRQGWFLISVTAVPGVLVAIPFGVIVAAQVGSIVSQLGADSLIGAAGGLGVIKQGAPLATGLLLGGAGAAAIAADLGARTIREEVDAMRVMGVDPVARLVVPRMVAMVVVAPLINILILVVGISAGYGMAAHSGGQCNSVVCWG